MTVEETADLILAKLYTGKVDRKVIFDEIPNAQTAVQLLTKNHYINRFWNRPGQKPEFNYYQITPSGKQFHENGGYKGVKQYNQTILDTAVASKNLAYWAIGLAAFSILLTLLLWILGRGK